MLILLLERKLLRNRDEERSLFGVYDNAATSLQIRSEFTMILFFFFFPFFMVTRLIKLRVPWRFEAMVKYLERLDTKVCQGSFDF